MKPFYIPIHYYEQEAKADELVTFLTRREIDKNEFGCLLNNVAAQIMAQAETHLCENDVVDSIFTELTKVLGGTWSYCQTLPELVIGDPALYEKNKTMRKIDASELAALLIKLETGERLDFYESFDEETGETDGVYGARMVNEFDSHVIFINYYGGGYPCVIDVTCYDSDLKRITEELDEYLREMGLSSKRVFIKTSIAKA